VKRRKQRRGVTSPWLPRNSTETRLSGKENQTDHHPTTLPLLRSPWAIPFAASRLRVSPTACNCPPTILPPLAPVKRGRGVGGEGATRPTTQLLPENNSTGQRHLLVLVLSPPWRTVLVLEKSPLTIALCASLRGFAASRESNRLQLTTDHSSSPRPRETGERGRG